jgi:STE24 endopeptidase
VGAINLYLLAIIVILAGGWLIDLAVEKLNIRNAAPGLPEEFAGYYDAEKYRTSQEYLKENTNFGLVSGGITSAVLLIFILCGGFNYADRFARSFNLGYIPTGLIFAGLLMLCSQLISVPFSAYHTFVIEEKYGFNKTTVRTFIADIIKNWLLGALVGGVIFTFVIWFFSRAGGIAWLYCWIVVTLFQAFLIFVAPVVILPLFNKFIPLEEGELKNSIEAYARSENFRMKGLFKMDGSKRSAKTNAFFTGFGRFRRIVLFDTLIARHTVDELVSVLAHEMGHYKKGHIVQGMAVSFLSSGLMFFILSFFINNRGLFDAFGMQEVSVYASLFFFAFLYSPINSVIAVFGNVISRKHEYESDAYAVRTYGKPEAMIEALKKLTVHNLSNLTPHPLKVFLEYSHPPVLERIRAVRELK